MTDSVFLRMYTYGFIQIFVMLARQNSVLTFKMLKKKFITRKTSFQTREKAAIGCLLCL